MGFGGVSPHAVAETLKTGAPRHARAAITINTFMLDDSPELVGFVERMTEINRGRAFFTSPRQLGSFLMVDYLNHRKSRTRAQLRGYFAPRCREPSRPIFPGLTGASRSRTCARRAGMRCSRPS